MMGMMWMGGGGWRGNDGWRCRPTPKRRFVKPGFAPDFANLFGGGLGAVAHQAKIMYSFLSEEEILPLMQAVGRVFARLGEKKNRAKARVKFLVAKLGLEEFTRLVEEERKKLPHDDNWTSYIDELSAWVEKPKKKVADLRKKVSSLQKENHVWLVGARIK